jgi:uncharacterized protein
MSRPCKQRRIVCTSRSNSFIPFGNSDFEPETISLTLDELEAVRLADLDGLYQEQAALIMQISRQTFGNIISSAHKKIADFLVNSKRLTIQGGKVASDKCSFLCDKCNNTWTMECGDNKPVVCPSCNNMEVFCARKSTNNHNVKCWRI